MQKRRTNLYNQKSKEPFNISRSKIALFLECPQCFYLDRKLGIARPDTLPFNLNNAVDHLLKNEFDYLRERKESHPLMVLHQIDAIPFWHPNFHLWRDDIKRVGAVAFHKETNLNIHGMVDDIWSDKKNQQLHIVDYKATSTDYKISLDAEYRLGYKRQLEVYQWIFKKMGFLVSDKGYFLFANARRNRPGFGGKLDFESIIIPYQGDGSWIEPTILSIKECLESPNIPESSPACQYCAWRKLISNESLKKQISLI